MTCRYCGHAGDIRHAQGCRRPRPATTEVTRRYYSCAAHLTPRRSCPRCYDALRGQVDELLEKQRGLTG